MTPWPHCLDRLQISLYLACPIERVLKFPFRTGHLRFELHVASPAAFGRGLLLLQLVLYVFRFGVRMIAAIRAAPSHCQCCWQNTDVHENRLMTRSNYCTRCVIIISVFWHLCRCYRDCSRSVCLPRCRCVSCCCSCRCTRACGARRWFLATTPSRSCWSSTAAIESNTRASSAAWLYRRQLSLTMLFSKTNYNSCRILKQSSSTHR